MTGVRVRDGERLARVVCGAVLNRLPVDLSTAGHVEVAIRSEPVDGCRPDVAAALTGAHAAVAALAGLRWSTMHRRLMVVDVSTSEVIATCTRAAPAMTDRHLDLRRCADGFVGIATPSAEDRQLLATLVGQDGPDRWLATRTRNEVVETAQLWRLPVLPVLWPDEVVRDNEPFTFTWTAASPRRSRPGSWPLVGLRVLDLGMVWAGPYCGRLLAGLGAQVIKIEGPARPDGTRPTSVFADLNRGKSSLVLDLSNASGRDAFLRLVRRADMLVENFSPRVMSNFGLDYRALAQANPRLLMLSMPAVGGAGPWANYVAYGSGLEVATGLAGRRADGSPVLSSVAYLDYLAGCYGAIGLLAALLARDASGDGAHVEVSQREVACQVLGLGDGQPSSLPGLLANGPTRNHHARLPFRFHGLRPRRERAAPEFGMHSRRVLRQAGLSGPAIDDLVRAGVVV